MNMKRFGFLIVFIALWIGSASVFASGTSYPAAATVPNADPMTVTKTMKCRVLEVAPSGALKIQDPKTEDISWIRLSEDTKLRAQDKKAFDGRKKLEANDLQVGQMLRITHRPHDGAILRIKVLRQS